jgi:hypothetical protein
MKKATLGLLSTLLLFSIMAALPASSGIPSDDVEIGIQVSPSTILLNWKAKGDVRITVHAEVSFRLFDTNDIQVELGGIPASYIYSDARGDLVGKFPYELVKELVGPGTSTLSLRAVAKDGTVYYGSDDVRVVGD